MNNFKLNQEEANFLKEKGADMITNVANVITTIKNPAAVMLGRLGGLKGGKARAASLTAEKRSEIAKAAATKRWAKKEE